jgi:hypothetical protein
MTGAGLGFQTRRGCALTKEFKRLARLRRLSASLLQVGRHVLQPAGTAIDHVSKLMCWLDGNTPSFHPQTAMMTVHLPLQPNPNLS